MSAAAEAFTRRGQLTDGRKSYKWVVEIEVSETWVEDGFELTDERAHNMLAHELSYAYGHEFAARVLKRPDPQLVAIAQGCKPEELLAELKSTIAAKGGGK